MRIGVERAGLPPALRPSYIGAFDPNTVWEFLIGGIVVASFLAAIGLWTLSALRRAKHANLRRSAFISSALNNLNQGVMMTNAQNRVVFCNDRFLEMYGVSRADISSDMTGRDLLELRRARGVLSIYRRRVRQACPPPGRHRHRTAGWAVGAFEDVPLAQWRHDRNP